MNSQFRQHFCLSKMRKGRAGTLPLIVILLLEMLTRTESIPEDLQDAMGKATSLETFMELLNASDISSQRHRFKANDIGTPLTIANEFCKPIEVMVEVPQPKKKRALVFPVYVKLFRCRGGCDVEPRLSQCVATERKEIPVKVGRVSWRKGENTLSGLRKKVEIVNLQNDTQCGCTCKKKRHCNPRSHVWNDRTCRCECKLAERSCPGAYVWNIHSCKCECPKSKHVCHGSGKVWNQKLCKCTCHDSMSCSAGYYLNPETCRCTCHRNWCKIVAIDKFEKRFDKDTIELIESDKV